MSRHPATLFKHPLNVSTNHPTALAVLALASLVTAQPANAAEGVNHHTPLATGASPQLSAFGKSTVPTTISTTVASPPLSASPQFSHGSEVQLAQAIIPANDGTGSVVTQTGNTFDITGGTPVGSNLFHSFEQLGLDAGQVANLIADPAIANILGRVTGGDASVINGLLQVMGGNANLFLMNPAGIIFGPNAQVIVPGAFTATTASAIQLEDYWFNALGTNDYANLVAAPSGFAFANSSPGAVINAGNLSGESVTLLGGFVVNTGTIDAPGGKITIASVPGENLVRITQEGSLLSLELPVEAQDNLNNEAQALNTIEIPELLSSTSAPQNLGLVVDNGVVRLASTNTILPTEAGTTIASGTLDASDAAPGGTGGTIDVLGNRVALLDATLQVSGSAGGGTARVGGDYRGQGTVPNAEQTYVGAGSTIAADALAAGDGGRVIVWADGSTRFYGAVSTRGGAVSGDGGFAEVSGRETLVFDGTVDVSAANGAAGTLLLDPRNIRISDEPSTPEVDSELPDIFRNNFLGREITISATALTRQEGDVILEATDDITVDDDLSLNFAACSAFPCSIVFRADADGNRIGSFRMDRNQSIIAPGRSVMISGSAVTSGNILTRNNNNSSNSIWISSNSTLSVRDIQSQGTVDLDARGSINTGTIQNDFVGLDATDDMGVFITSQEGDIRVVGIRSIPGIIEIDAEGIFQATGVIQNFTDSTFPPLLDLDSPENADIKLFLISRELLRSDGTTNEAFVTPSGHVLVDRNGRPAAISSLISQGLLESDGRINTAFVTISGDIFVDRNGRLVPASLVNDDSQVVDSNSQVVDGNPQILGRRLLITRSESGRRSIFNNTSIPVSILAVVTQQEERIQITHSGRAIESVPASVREVSSQNSTESETNISIQGNGEGQFIIGPSITRRQNSGTNNFEFRNTGDRLEILAQDYSLLVFGSDRFPKTVSGTAGAIFIAGLNGSVGAAVVGVEYEPPQAQNPPQEPRGNSNNPEVSLTRNSTLLASSDSLDNSDKEDSEDENDACEMFDSSEVLSVEEVAPEECEASTAPETPSARPQDEESSSISSPPMVGSTGSAEGTEGTTNLEIATTNERALLTSVNDSGMIGEQTSREASENDACEMFDSSEVLSVEEIAPEECEASTAPEALLVGAQDEETP